MLFGDVLRRCTYGSTGYIDSESALSDLEATLRRNLPVLGEFRRVAVATNFAEGGETGRLARTHEQLWRDLFPDVALLNSATNRGHSIGTADLDNMLFDHCKATGDPWLCKTANDVWLDQSVLGIEVTDAQFYYFNAVAYAALAKSGFELERFTVAGGFLYPQTNFYVIDVHATDYLVDKDFLDRSWAYVRTIPEYNGRIWEYIPGWACEALLAECVRRNRLSTCHLATPTQYEAVLAWVLEQQIEDCSHKGLRINGVCHAQGVTCESAIVDIAS